MFSKKEQEILDMPSFARLATISPEGAPHAAVMWFRPDGYSLRMVTLADTRKASNIETDDRVVVLVEEPGNPYNFVEIRGTIEVVYDDNAARIELQRIAERYVGERAEAFVKSRSDDQRVLLVVHPEKTNHHRGTGPEF